MVSLQPSGSKTPRPCTAALSRASAVQTQLAEEKRLKVREKTGPALHGALAGGRQVRLWLQVSGPQRVLSLLGTSSEGGGSQETPAAWAGIYIPVRMGERSYPRKDHYLNYNCLKIQG